MPKRRTKLYRSFLFRISVKKFTFEFDRFMKVLGLFLYSHLSDQKLNRKIYFDKTDLKTKQKEERKWNAEWFITVSLHCTITSSLLLLCYVGVIQFRFEDGCCPAFMMTSTTKWPIHWPLDFQTASISSNNLPWQKHDNSPRPYTSPICIYLSLESAGSS